MRKRERGKMLKDLEGLKRYERQVQETQLSRHKKEEQRQQKADLNRFWNKSR